VIFDPHQILGT